MSRRVATISVSVLLAVATSSGCGWFHRDRSGPTDSPTPSSSSSSSTTASSSTPAATRSLADVLSRTQSAGGASVQVSAQLSGSGRSNFSGALDLWTGEGQGDFTSASGRVAQRIIKGGKTYTEAGSSWVATAQSGRGVLGGDFPSLWRAVKSTAMSAASAQTYQGSIAVTTALQLAGIDANAIASLNLSGATATLTLTYDADGVVQNIAIRADLPSASKTLTLNAAISDVGQIIDVTAPNVVITGGPEGQ